VFILLYLNTRSLVETGIVLLAVPFSLVGAIWLLYTLDYSMSVAVWVGLIALAGLDASVPRKSRHSCARDSGGASARVGGHAATRRGAASRLARRSLGVCQPSA
jgi:Cu(I)/Ag(I) efflux system membrane protein CusA/SilA